MKTETEEALERRIEAGLAELLGGERCPDLSRAVSTRHRRGESVVEPPEPRHRQRLLWAAALLVLGLGAVLAVALLDRGGARVDESTADQDPLPEPVVVHSRQEIEGLPVDTRAVQGIDLTDDDVRALARLRELASLELRCPRLVVTGLGLKTFGNGPSPSITAAGLETISQLARLRRLRMVGTHRLAAALGPSAEPEAASALDGLERLPMLEELELSYFDTGATALAVLPRLANLRRLSLRANHGFAGDGLDHIARCSRLRELDLGFCQQLGGADLARLGNLESLEVLDLEALDGLNWRSATDDPHTDRLSAPADLGVTDRALDAWADLPRLRVLRIAQAHCTEAGLAAFADSETLEELDVFGAQALGDSLPDSLPTGLRSLTVCGEFTDAFCARLRARCTALESLTMPACYRMGDAGLAELVRIGTLRDLDLRQSRGLTPAAMDSLRAATQLRSLDLRHIDWFGDEQADELREALPELVELQH